MTQFLVPVTRGRSGTVHVGTPIGPYDPIGELTAWRRGHTLLLEGCDEVYAAPAVTLEEAADLVRNALRGKVTAWER